MFWSQKLTQACALNSKQGEIVGDIFDEKVRSDIMRKVKSKGNKSTELRLIKLFKENGINRWRRNYPVKGHPDFIFLDKRVAIFVDGCFWHGHNCRNTKPREHSNYWNEKLSNNLKRDSEITDLFNTRGWSVLRIWECELKRKNQAETLLRIVFHLNRFSL